MRTIAAVIGGLVAWVVVATLGNFALRALLPGYPEAEPAMTFTTGMQASRLILGAVASLAAGGAAARVARDGGRAAWVLAAVLVALFIPTHYSLWDRFPLWYHAVFFASLILVTAAGARLVRRAPAAP